MRFLLSGYYGFGNLGDEWLLDTTVQHLQALGHHVTVLSHHPRQTAETYHVPTISRWNPASFLIQLWKHDVLLFGGGGLIQDRSSGRSVFYYLAQIVAAKILGKKVVMLGQGLGPLEHAGTRLGCELLLPLVDMIVTRDVLSSGYGEELGLDKSRVIEAADLAWLRPFSLDRAASKNLWVVCLRPWGEASALAKAVRELQALATTHNRTLVFLPFGGYGDKVLLEDLRQKGVLEGCRAARQEDYLQVMSRAEIVISMRYHALLLGARAGALLLGLSVDPKVQSLVRELGQLDAAVEDMAQKTGVLLARRHEFEKKLEQTCPALIKKAGKNLLSLQVLLLQ